MTSRRVAAIAGALAAALVTSVAASAGAHSFDQPDRVLVGTTGHDSELVTSVDIGTAPGQGATVVMSLAPDELGALAPGDRVLANSEAEVTTDCQIEAPRCVGEPYTYNPTVDSQLILAPNPIATDGPDTVPLSGLSSRTCRHDQHHCVLVFGDSAFDVPDSAQPSCLPAGCYVNLVVSAYSSSAKPGDKLIIGEDEPDGTVVIDKGRVNGVRLRPVVPGPEPVGSVSTFTTSTPLVSRVPVRNKLADGKTVVFSQRLDKLNKNEQLSVSASMTSDIAHLRQERILVNSRLILASRPDQTNPSDLVKRVAELNGELADANGFNCTHVENTCLTQKVGVTHLIEDARTTSGSRVPLYVNLVVGSTAAGGQVRSGDRLKITGGELKVVRYPATRYG